MRGVRCFAAATAGVVCAIALPALAQSPLEAQYQIKRAEVVAELQRRANGGLISATDAAAALDTGIEFFLMQLARVRIPEIWAETNADAAKNINAARLGKQIGADPGGAGSTSLVADGTVPAIFGMAVEAGGLTQSQSSSTLTFRGNVYGLVKALSGSEQALRSPFAPQFDIEPSTAMRRWSFGVSFDLNRDQPEDAEESVFTGSSEQLSALSFRFELVNSRSPWTNDYQTRFAGAFRRGLAPINDAVTKVESGELARLQDDWKDAVGKAIENTPAAGLEDAMITASTTYMRTLELTPRHIEILTKYVEDYRTLLSNRDEALNAINSGTVVALEYVYGRPADSSSLSTVRFITDWSLAGGKASATLNAEATLLNSSELVPDGVGNLRDWAVAGQMETILGQLDRGRTVTLTLAGRAKQIKLALSMEEMMESMAEGEMTPAMFAQEDMTEWLVQGKITLPIPQGGIKVPISVTWSNRPELIDETDVRGDVGFTLDLDAFFGS